MTIKEVYEKYKHLDALLSDHEWLIDGEKGEASRTINRILFDCWQAIKKSQEGK